MLNPIGYLYETIKQYEAEQATKDHIENIPTTTGSLTYGPFGNNLGSNYAFDKGSWNINFIDKMNSDIVVIFLSKMCQMYRKTSKPTLTLPITRKVKDLLIKDKFPHHVSKDW